MVVIHSLFLRYHLKWAMDSHVPLTESTEHAVPDRSERQKSLAKQNKTKCYLGDITYRWNNVKRFSMHHAVMQQQLEVGGEATFLCS